MNLRAAIGEIILRAQGVKRGVTDAIKELRRLSAAGTAESDAFRDAYQKNFFALRDIGAVAGGMGVAIAAGFAKAFQAAVEWETAMAGVERTTYEGQRANETYEQSVERNARSLADLEKQLFDLASRKPISTVDLAKIAEEAGALGIASKDIGAFTGVIADIAATTDLSSDIATSSLARIANIMGNTTAEFERMGSTTLELGRSTAATEGEIVTMSRRIAGAGKTVGLSTDQVLAYAAALASVGVREEQGGSAISRTFIDIAQAVSDGGETLDAFAATAGTTAAEFKQQFQTDAAGATARFVEGLGWLQREGHDLFGVMESLGITELRQRDALLRLASAQGLLTRTLDTGASAWEKNEALAEIAERRYNTFQGQLDIFKNSLFELGVQIGEGFINPMKAIVDVLSNVVEGLSALPGPMKAMFVIGVALVGVMGGLVAVFTFLVPRMIAARIALLKLGGAAHFAGVAMGFLQKAMGWISAALAAAAVVMYAFGKSQKSAAEDADELAEAQGRLQAAIQDANKGTEEGIRLLAVQAMEEAGIGRLLEQHGMGLRDVADAAVAAATGTEDSSAAFQEYMDIARRAGQLSFKPKDEWTEADHELKRLSDTMMEFLGGVASNRHQLEKFNEKMAEAGILTEEAAQAMEDAAKANEENIERINKMNEAMIDLVEAQRSQKEATLDLAEAQAEYAEAQNAAANAALLMQQAEDRVTQARGRHEEAIRDEQKAEQALATAREEALIQQMEAEWDLADARESALDAMDRVRDIQEQIQELRGVDYTQDLKKATDDLADAYQSLAHAEVDVQDAQWQLNYLMEEGASVRDIADANMALTDAILAREQAENSIADAIEAVEELSPAETARKRAELERDLQQALRDVQRANRDVANSEKALQQIRNDIAADTAYKEAEQALIDARIATRDALIEVQDQTTALQLLQSGQLERDFMQAQLDLEDAYYRLATANVEVQRQQALSRGEMWTSEDQVRALRNELLRMGQDAVGPVAANLRSFGETLRVNTLPKRVVITTDTSGAISPIEEMTDKLGGEIEEQEGLWERLWNSIEDGWGGLLDVLKLPSDTGFFDNPIFSWETWKFWENHAKGGLFTKPHLGMVGEAGPELILPLSNMSRTWQLLKDSGLLDQIAAQLGLSGNAGTQIMAHLERMGVAAGRGASSISNSRVTHGDNFEMKFLTNANPMSIASQIAWRKRIRTRG